MPERQWWPNMPYASFIKNDLTSFILILLLRKSKMIVPLSSQNVGENDGVEPKKDFKKYF